MNTLIPILLLSVILAFLSEKSAIDSNGTSHYNVPTAKLCFALLVCVLAIPVGLRTSYNDTWAYIQGFQNSPLLADLIYSGKLHLLANPAFSIFESLIKTLTGNYHILFMVSAFFIQYAFVKTIQRYSHSFPMGILIYICLGTYVFTFAAQKQTIAMAFLMLAIPKLLDKKYLQFYLLVLVAFLFHTYAIAFVVLPLFVSKPWGWRTVVLLVTVAFVFLNFESVIGSFLDYANEQGKYVADYEVFDDNRINVFRVIVYTVVPFLSFFFQRYLKGTDGDVRSSVFIHMSIISWAFMVLGTVNGANMFGRMANYFEIGMICSISWIIHKVFEPRSAKLVSGVAVICFSAYFVYAWHINVDFDTVYYSITIFEFFKSLLA